MGWVGRLVVRLIGVAWTLASYFVVPVLAEEDLGPIEALRRSADLFRETWGEQVDGDLLFGSGCRQRRYAGHLYRYASTKQLARGFRPENFSMAWQPKR